MDHIRFLYDTVTLNLKVVVFLFELKQVREGPRDWVLNILTWNLYSLIRWRQRDYNVKEVRNHINLDKKMCDGRHPVTPHVMGHLNHKRDQINVVWGPLLI